MLTNTDIEVLDNYEKLITSKPTRKNLENYGCIFIKERYDAQEWEIIYKGERYEFTRDLYSGTLKICCKHYTNSKKTAWISYGHEYANNLKELFDWIDAEIEFYNDHPEEKYGSPEWKRKQEQTLAVCSVFEELRWKFNSSIDRIGYGTIDRGPKNENDVIWYSLYAEACKITEQKHPELFTK